MKQTYLFILFLLLLSVNTICAQNIKSFCGGSGTEIDPYQICTPQDLADLAEMVNTIPSVSQGIYYIVVNDLDLIDYTAGEGWVPIGSSAINHYFRGNFDGNGKVISNLVINRPAGNYQGLFGYTTVGATIKNLGIENCNITGSVEVGGLVGRSLVSSIINCYATGNVTGTGGITGGLVGTVVGSYLINCYVSGNVTGIDLVGGLTGLISDNSSEINHIINCYAISEVTGNDMVGGLVGLNVGGSSTIDSYACGNVTGNNWVGGLIGATQINANSIENCYAFNCKVEATAGTNVGRIIGGWIMTVANLNNNYAYNQMKLWANSIQITPTPNPNGKDGADISYENAINPATYAAWIGSAWTFDYPNNNVTPETNLPILSAFMPSAFPNAVQEPQIKECSHGCLDLYTTGVSSEGCLELEWKWNPPKPTGTYGFTLYQWGEAIGEWQTASTNYDKEIKVLNVYPNIEASNTLQTWMNDTAIGLGKIVVTPVSITDFNYDPNSWLKDEAGEYKYDAIMFGSWDGNNSRDLNQTSANAVRNFLNSGRGVIFGHDTQRSAFTYFESLIDKTNLYIVSDQLYRRGSERIKVVNDGFLLKYPHVIPYESILTIPLTHSSGQFARGIVWMSFPDPLVNPGIFNSPIVEMDGGTNNFYLTTWNNAAMIQTGHNPQGISTPHEQRVIANLLWYVAQFTTDTTAKVCSALDITAPDVPTVNRYDCTKIDILSNDNGTPYSFYVKATNTVNYADTCTSNILDAVNKSGLKGFYVLEDNNPVGIPESSNPATQFIAATDNQLVTYITDPIKYVHIQAIDSAGNLSTVLTLEPPDCVEFYANNVHYESLEDTVFCYKTVNFHAEIYGEFDTLKWFFKKVEDQEYEEYMLEENSLNWSKNFETGEYEIKMEVYFANGEPVILEAILRMKILWIKMRNVRY